jgi:transcriptional regulator with XRE-family HTH domain
MGWERSVLTPELSAAHRWGARLRALRDERRLSLAALGTLTRYDPSHLGRLERGGRFATLAAAEACDRALAADGELIRCWHQADQERRRDAGGQDGPGPDPAAGGGDAFDEATRRVIAVMPLHAITAIHGEQGLRARFAAEIARLPDPAERERAGRALQLAGRLHAADRRQREPYVNHLLRVAVRIMSPHHYGVGDPDVICAALLHDAVEDHADGLAAGGRDSAVAALAADFGARTAGLVEAVTNPEWEPGDRDEQYRAHVAASLAASPWARVIKASDFTDNGVGLHHTTGPKAARLARKYAPLVPVLADLTARPDTPLSLRAKALILGQLCNAQERFAVIDPAPGGEADRSPGPA